MRNNIVTILKKECTRFFKDKRMLFSTVLLPGVMIFFMYSFMGVFLDNMFQTDDDYVYQIHVVNMPASIGAILQTPGLRLEIHHITQAQVAGIRTQIENQETDLLLVFPVGFDEIIVDFDPATATAPAPNVEIWSNSARTESAEARHLVQSIITGFHHELTHRFTINAPTEDAPYGVYDLITDADMFAMVIGMIVPMLLLIFIFSASQSLAPESIAGEKERGTLAGMLVTPVSRRDLAMGKIISISLFCMLSALGSIIGMLLSMPNMMGFGNGFAVGQVFEWYSASDLIFLVLVATSTSLVFVSILSILSAYAKTIKEATAYAMPLMLVCVFAGFASTIIGDVPESVVFYLIPILNSSLSISGIFSFDASAVNMAVTAGVNTLFAVAASFVLAYMFSSEKIVFDK